MQPNGVGDIPKILHKKKSDTNGMPKVKIFDQRKQQDDVASCSSDSFYRADESNVYLLIKPTSIQCLKMGFVQNKWKFNEKDFYSISRYFKVRENYSYSIRKTLS